VLKPRRGRGGGLVVTAPDRAAVTRTVALLLSYQQLTVEELEDIRQPLELLAVRLAAQRIAARHVDDDSARRIQEVVAAEQSDPFGVGITQHMPNLHVVLAEVAGNRALEMFAEINTAVSRQGAALRGPGPSNHLLIQEHAEIAAAVLSGDVEVPST
jgi:DNA-binding FadR family transcriptional regulator